MAGIGPLRLLFDTYKSVKSADNLARYATRRLPPELSSIGGLTPLPGGTGRKVFALGDELVVKVPRLPRGVMENRLASDTYAPIPEQVFATDDDTLSVVKRAQPAGKELGALMRAIQRARADVPNRGHPEWDGNFQEVVKNAGFGDLLDYDTLWGDLMPRNVGVSSGRNVLLDEGVLSKSILDPSAVMDDVPLDLWLQYRGDVMRKACGGRVRTRGANADT